MYIGCTETGCFPSQKNSIILKGDIYVATGDTVVVPVVAGTDVFEGTKEGV